MNDKNKDKNLLNDDDFISVSDLDNYYIDETTGLGVKETYTKEDEKFDEGYDISKFYVEYELTDEEIDFFETFLKSTDKHCPMSLAYYLSILDGLRHHLN